MRPPAVTLLLAWAVLAVPAPAAASVETHRLRYGPIALGGYETVFPKAAIKTPRVDGYVVGMHARLVDRHGKPVTIRDVMLHHIFFHRRREAATKYPCASRKSEAFYGTGEEDQRLALPDGYGYPLRKSDRWRMGAMLMSHTLRSLNVYIEYEVTVETDRRLTPVQAFWVRANGCGPASGYFLQGNGISGSTDKRTFAWRIPYDLRIVAAGGHLHGGAKDMWLTQPRCGDRRLLDNRPSYGMPEHLYYTARPILHEPGPVDTRYFMSGTGIPAREGEILRLHGTYDAELPRPVMAVMHVYVARAKRVEGCRPLPADGRQLTKPGPVRTDPPQTQIPLSGLDSRGRTVTITDPPWPVTPLGETAEVDVSDVGFSPRRFTVPSASEITWRFTGAEAHNVRLASGPRLVFSPSRARGTWTNRFDVPGRYTLFCSRHPVTMHAVLDVLPST